MMYIAQTHHCVPRALPRTFPSDSRVARKIDIEVAKNAPAPAH
jgi:hypothetical protein